MTFLPCGDRALFRRQVVCRVYKGQSLPRPVTDRVYLKLGNVMTSWAKSLNSEGKTGGNCGGPCHCLVAFMPCCASWRVSWRRSLWGEREQAAGVLGSLPPWISANSSPGPPSPLDTLGSFGGWDCSPPQAAGSRGAGRQGREGIWVGLQKPSCLAEDVGCWFKPWNITRQR